MGLLSIKRCLPAPSTRFNSCILYLHTRTNQRKPQTPQPRKAAGTTTNSAITTTVFAATTIYAATLTALMTLAPTWKLTQHIMRTSTLAPLVPLALAYGFLILGSWQPDTFSLILPGSLEDGFKAGFSPQFFPKLTGIMTLFSRSATAASLWVHILAVNMFVARSVYVGAGSGSVGLLRRLVIVCCATFAPVGLLLSDLLLTNVGDTK
jgi:hypothetical protein